MSNQPKAQDEGYPIVWQSRTAFRGQPLARVEYPVGPSYIGDPPHAVLFVGGEPVANAWDPEALKSYARRELLPLDEAQTLHP